jgi:hypothetical protein
VKPVDTSVAVPAASCTGNITACEYQFLRSSGQINSQGLPTGKTSSYTGPPEVCNPAYCTAFVISKASVPAPGTTQIRVASSSGCTSGDIRSNFAGNACVPSTSAAGAAQEAADSYGPETFACQGFYICAHFQGEAQVLIGALGIIIAGLCGGCDAPLLAAALGAGIGGGEGAADYAVSPGPHNAEGFAVSIVSEALPNALTAGTGSLLVRVAGGGEALSTVNANMITIPLGSLAAAEMYVIGNPSATNSGVFWSAINGGYGGVSVGSLTGNDDDSG